MATKPTTTMMIEITAAKMGRSMKKRGLTVFPPSSS
jgi:hypothetical protein